ncbi:acyl-CoA dehydrogenase family protein [Streptomyces sp. BPTC-684]|uniref:acyl-CoA dehydrogenase family protein n=1 Tax=Streptomyces sp. BPTC-684 TaxID=3043734 RepID=UPI0024B17B0F|nr:acyl-CoA dehydrogenase family protein [Streptomyces sp. BPTC-684]WHM38197.1 acyl-CoA dehydrogenase family protein [Streptomyces sp. BPTC-684]
MDADFTPEQHEIRRTLRTLLAKRCGPDEVKAAVRTAPGYDPALWQRLAKELGLPGLAIPEAYGGVGCGPAELALACEETGRALLPSPLLATAALAAPLLLALGTEPQKHAYLPPLARGELTATLAVPGPALAPALGLTGDDADGAWAGGGRAGGIQARRVDNRWRLYGEASQVLDAHRADLLLVPAHTGGFPRSRVQLFLVRGDADGLRRVRQTTLDETRSQGRIQLREVVGELMGDADPLPALADTGRTTATALAAEAVGAAAHVLERTVAYVKEREQFGRPIGSFQAVKHRLADRYVQVQAARSAAYYAAWDPDAGGLALAQALEALRSAAAEAIQLHGGIGFTWEHEAHLYFKRAASDELLFGPVPLLRARAADRAGLFRERTTGTRVQAATR